MISSSHDNYINMWIFHVSWRKIFTLRSLEFALINAPPSLENDTLMPDSLVLAIAFTIMTSC